jgi:hypothetical protein
MKYRNTLDASDMAIQKISASSKKDASNALKTTLLSNVQEKQEFKMLNVFCAIEIILCKL